MSEAPDGPFDDASRQMGASTSDRHAERHSGARAGSTADSRPEPIAHDERDHSIKEWPLETGVYSRDIQTGRLSKLESNDLFIADSAIRCLLDGDDASRGESRSGDGCHPYDNSSTSDGNVAGTTHNGAGDEALKPGARPRQPTSRQPG